MAKVDSTVRAAIKDLRAQLTQIDRGDEDDLGQLAAAFYGISETADQAGQTLEAADNALAGDNGEGEGEDQDEEPPQDD